MALPASLLVQFPQVASVFGAVGGASVPSACEPVRMSCWLGVSPRPLTIAPFSVREFSLLRAFMSECRCATSLATTTPFALIHGPLPMRSRAFTAGCPPIAAALRYARHVRLPAPAAAASVWQCLSAPASPPRLAPLPGPALVMKNDILLPCAETPREAAAANTATPRKPVIHFVMKLSLGLSP